MRNRLKIALSILGVVALGVIFWELLTAAEPRYQGRPLHLWLADFDLSPTRQPERAAEAVRASGTNALPLLTQMICTKDPRWKIVLMALNDRQSYFQVPLTEARVVRFRAVEAYRILGALGKGSVPTLIRIMTAEPRPEVRADVATALGWIGPAAEEAIPALLQASENPDPQLRQCALIALTNIRRFESGRGFEPR